MLRLFDSNRALRWGKKNEEKKRGGHVEMGARLLTAQLPKREATEDDENTDAAQR